MSSKPSSNLKNSTQSKTPTPARSEHRKNTKITGERSEAAFLARAIDMGFGIAKPWGDSRRYDFILDNGECLHRIQVKCTSASAPVPTKPARLILPAKDAPSTPRKT